MNTQLSTNSKAILTQLMTGPATSKVVAEAIGLAVPVVTGSLAGLKKSGFIEVLDTKELALTTAGIQLMTPAEVAIVEASPQVVAATKDVVDATPEADAAAAAEVEAAKTVNKGDRKAAAQKIVDSIPAGSKRSVYIKRFMEELKMSKAGASTYHYNLVGNKGRWK